MKILLDTHAVLWWLNDDARLRGKALATIADPAHELCISAATPWEIAIKVGIGKLQVDIAQFVATLASRGVATLETRPAHLVALAELERHHGDPFDRMIVAQALCEGATIMTDDGMIVRYPVRTVTCR